MWGAFAGPLIALASFTCSVGNIPLAGVLWHGGISVGGVASFIFGDLIILPILNIYRKYYGARMTAFMLVTFYAAMFAASLVVEGIFAVAGWIPARPKTGSAAHTASPSPSTTRRFSTSHSGLCV
ncbi:permease [Paraburkholderia sp. SIMBA_054]|uniref:permease n=1 Tax=Paraburkholderia sp. SIMBA_054 TaxID=3085795 RepID=UPI00397AFA09